MAVASMHIERGHWERVLRGLLVVLALLFAGSSAHAKPRTHKVYPGQRLGSIAKRYRVSVAAIAHANDIANPAKIAPGSVLVIPDRDDANGKRARREFEKRQEGRANTSEDKKSRSGPTADEKKKRSKSKSDERESAKLHRVARGQSLGAIARRYRTSIAAICHANEINRRDALKVGLQLVVPAPGDADGSRALAAKARLLRADKQARALKRRVNKKGWRRYARTARHKGYVTLLGHHGRWKGYVIGRRGKLLPAARKSIGKLLDQTGNGPRINPRLIRLIAKVSDKFGGRPLRVVSGFRKKSFVDDSRHRHGRAIDFHIPGVPNEALRDYLLTLDRVGVGYYPNSTFVHFDVRRNKTYWVDLAGPGQPPRYAKVLRLD